MSETYNFTPVRKRAYSSLSLVEPSLVDPNFVEPSLFADILVEVNWLTAGLVTMAFLVAMRLLISDFFSIDIACSSFRLPTDVLMYCTAIAKLFAQRHPRIYRTESAT